MWLCCALFIFFCFFKQKKAYEWRISDWRSDVCSSDLVFGCVACGKEGLALRCALEEALAPVEEARRARVQRHAVLGVIDCRREQVSPFELAEFLLHRQIGTASCRARVCQYVSLPVGAVSLKTHY